MTLTRTYTKTYTILHAWASTTPGTESLPVDTPCAWPSCGKPLLAGEECYAVTELDDGPDGRNQYVCWRHVRPNEGPVT